MYNHLCRLALLVSGIALLAGCPSSQNWTTARALPQGAVQHTVGVEWLGILLDEESGCDPVVDPGCDTVDNVGFLYYPFPAYAVRFGVADGMDLGLKASTTGLIGLDFKLQFVESDGIDLAVDPGIAWAFFVSYLTLPVLLSINLGDTATLTIGPKINYLFVTGELDGDSYYADGLLVGGGISIQIRASPTFAITPGVEFQRIVTDTGGDVGFSFVSFGLGFSFGGMPQHGPEPVAEPMPAGPPPAQPGYGPQPGYAPQPAYGPPAGAPPPAAGPPPAGSPAPPPGY